MNRHDIVFPHDHSSDGYVRLCMDNKWTTNQDAVNRIAAESSTSEEFIERYLAEGEPTEMFYQILLKTERPERVWKYIRVLFGERQFKTISDDGGLLVGSPSCFVLIPNGHGDGATRVCVFNSREEFFPLENLMNPFTMVSGQQIGVYAYDCAEPDAEPLVRLTGRFAAYYKDGFVALVRLE